MPEKCSCHGLRVAATVFVLWLFFYFSVVCYKQLVFLVSLAHFPCFIDSIFLSTAFSIHIARKTYFLLRSGFWNIF